MYLTTENYKEFLGKKIDSTSRHFHYYPLEVIEINGKPYYKDSNGVCMAIPKTGDKLNSVCFDKVIEE